jgi:hypothetical protein
MANHWLSSIRTWTTVLSLQLSKRGQRQARKTEVEPKNLSGPEIPAFTPAVSD